MSDPHFDKDAETQLIGCMMALPDCAPDVFKSGVRASDFSLKPEQAIYTQSLAQHTRGLLIDPPMIGAALREHPEFADGNAAGHIFELAAKVGRIGNLDEYINRVLEASRKRYLHEVFSHGMKCTENGKAAKSIWYEAQCALQDFDRAASKQQEQFTFAELEQQFPGLDEPVIDNIGRSGEVVNLVSYSKAGKTWLLHLLLLSVILGRKFLGRFDTTPGPCLLVDNELRERTLRHRMRTVATAMGISPDEKLNDLIIRPLRGRLRAFASLADELANIEHGQYQVIAFDSKYRFALPGVSENDNASETIFYNKADELAERTGALVLFIHHSAKGDQSNKRTTDVGAGAGAQSRACDTHLVLREHEQDNCAVMEAAVRSFPPMQPLALRWEYPLWLPADGIDPSRLKGKLTRSEQRQNDKDRDGLDATIKALRSGPLTARAVRTKTGFGEYRQERLLNLLTSQGHATKDGHEYQLSE